MEQTAAREPTVLVYLAVWAALVTLTVLTVALAGVGLGRLGILVALLVAGSKSALIAAYFMHLRYERVRLYAGLLLITFVVLAVFTSLTLVDVASR